MRQRGWTTCQFGYDIFILFEYKIKIRLLLASWIPELDKLGYVLLALVPGHELPADHLRPDVALPPLLRVDMGTNNELNNEPEV